MQPNGEPIFNPYLAVALGVAAVSFAAIFTRLATAPPLIIAFYRLAFTVLILAPLALSGAGKKELRTLQLKDLAGALLAGVFLGLHFLVWIASLQYTSIASSTVLVTMQPLFVVTLGYFFLQERISRGSAIGALLALSGSLIIGAGDFQLGGQAFLGDGLAFSGAFFVAIYMLIGRSLRHRFSLFPYVFLVFGSAALFLLSVNLFFQYPLFSYPGSDWLCFIALALLPTIFGHTVFNWALRYVPAAVVSVCILGEPVGATLLGVLIFKEAPGLFQLLGGAIIISGLGLFLYRVKA